MGASAGKVVGDGKSAGIHTINAGKNSDDDEDFNWEDFEEEGGGIQAANIPKYQHTVDGIQIVEQPRQNLAHQRHKRLHTRQELDGSLSKGAVDTVGKVVDVVSLKVSDVLATATPIVYPPTLEMSSLSIVSSSSLATSLPTDINTSLPIGSSLQTLLSSTPPPSPAQTSSGMTIPPTRTSSSSSSTTPPPSRDSTTTGLSTTITSYWPSLTFRNNGTTSSNTRSSTVTVDGTVIVFMFPTNSGGSNFSRSATSTSSSSTTSSSTSSSNSTTASTTSATSTTSTASPSFSSFTTDLWASGTGVAGGAGVEFATSTSSTGAVPSATPATASAGNSSPPVSPSLLGGVLGGVAGLAFVLVAILYLIRRHRREVAATARDEAGYGGPLGAGDGDMTQQSSVIPFALSGRFFAKESGASRVSQSSEAPTIPSETGFYKVSGRKLPPVLGGPRPGYGSTRSAGGSSAYPDEDGGSGTVASTPSVAGPSRYSSVTAASASPTSSTAPMSLITPVPTPVPVTHPYMGSSSSMAPPPPRIQEEAAENDTESTHKLPRPPPFPRQLSAISVGSAGKDGVGRSLPSHDGSRASRFTEDIV